MNFDYSDEQKLLGNEARKFLDARCPTAAVRRILESEDEPFDRGLWEAVAGLGWTGVAIPEQWGGTGLGHIALCALAEELGRSIAPIPFASAIYVFCEAILAFGTAEQRERLLPSIASGVVIGCLAASDEGGASASFTGRTTVTAGNLTGAKNPVPDGDIATHAIVTACDAEGPGLFLVDLADEQVARTSVPTLDPTRSAGRLQFDNVRCQRLGRAADGAKMLAILRDRAAILMAFEQVGAADRCLEDAVGYARDRFAFGRPIGSYQAIKHKLAEIYVRNQLARSNAYFGAWVLDSRPTELPQAAAAARIAATQAYDLASKENLQTHGGIGFTWEADCHLHLRRARQLALVLGGLPEWREKLVCALEKRAAA